MRRRLVLLVVVGAAVAVMGLGMALSASARQDNIAAVRAVTARFNSIVQASEIEPGVFIAIGTSRSRTIQLGAVMHIDPRSQAWRVARDWLDAL